MLFGETSEVLVGLDFEGRRAMLGSKKSHTFAGTDYPSYPLNYIQFLFPCYELKSKECFLQGTSLLVFLSGLSSDLPIDTSLTRQ